MIQQDELDHFPGGDAMLEVLTRLQSLQDSFYQQLQVIKHRNLHSDQLIDFPQANATQAGLSPNDRVHVISVNLTPCMPDCMTVSRKFCCHGQLHRQLSPVSKTVWHF